MASVGLNLGNNAHGLSSTQKKFVVSCSVLPALAFAAVVLQLASKRTTALKSSANDYVMIGCLVMLIASSGWGIYTAVGGFIGLRVDTYTVDDLYDTIYVCLVDNTIGNIVFGLVKISVVLFYKSIFTIRNSFKICANIAVVVISLWMIVNFSVGIPLYRRIDTASSRQDQELALAAVGVYVGANAIINLILDVLILTMPMPMIRSLKIPTPQKVGIAGIFLLGAFCTIASGIRLKYNTLLMTTSVDSPSWSIYIGNVMLWGHIECALSVIAACLPTYGPLFKYGIIMHKLVISVCSVFRPRGLHTKTYELPDLESQSNLSSPSSLNRAEPIPAKGMQKDGKGISVEVVGL